MNKYHYKSIAISEPYEHKQTIFTEAHEDRFYFKQQIKNHLYKTIKKHQRNSQEKPSTEKKIIKIKPMRTQNCEQYLQTKNKNKIYGHNKHNFSSFEQRSPLNCYNSNSLNEPQGNTLSQYAELQECQANKKSKTYSSSFHQIFIQPKQNHHLKANQLKNNETNENDSKNSCNKSSKSKKKIHFTVYQNRSSSDSLNKYKQEVIEKKENEKKKENEGGLSKKNYFNVPYRQNNQITINLFNPNEQKDLKKNKSSLNKSSGTSLTKKSESKRKQMISRSLPKAKDQTQKDETLNNTFLKLQNFKFVYEYFEKSEIAEMIAGFRFNDEPECKWILLIIDEVFKNRKDEGNYEKYLSK